MRVTMVTSVQPWERLRELILAENAAEVTRFVNGLSPSETARAISRLNQEEQLKLFSFFQS